VGIKRTSGASCIAPLKKLPYSKGGDAEHKLTSFPSKGSSCRVQIKKALPVKGAVTEHKLKRLFQ